MNPETAVEVVGLIALPVVLAIFGWVIHGYQRTIEDLRKADEAMAEEFEDFRKESETQWRDALKTFAQRDETRAEFNQLEQTMIRLENKIDQLVQRLISPRQD